MIKIFGQVGEEICAIDQGQFLFSLEGRTVMAGGQRVVSYLELVRLARQDKYKNVEFIEVVLLPTIAGGWSAAIYKEP